MKKTAIKKSKPKASVKKVAKKIAKKGVKKTTKKVVRKTTKRVTSETKKPPKAKSKVKTKSKVKATKTKTKVKAKPKTKTKTKTKTKAKIVKGKSKAKVATKKKVKTSAKPKLKAKVKVKVKEKAKPKTKKPVSRLAAIKCTKKPLAQKRAPVIRLKKGSGPVNVKPYLPKKNEEYMNEEQLLHFRSVLLKWKEQLMAEVDRTMHHMQDEVSNYPDPVDRASQEEEFSLELRARDRERKLLRKIQEALNRINDDDYGYCDDCGAEIGISRLEVRPTATQCIECKTVAEIREKQIGDGSLFD